MAEQRLFPKLTPSSRSYKPGKLPETVFTSQNGSTTFVQFGGAFVNAELNLEFRNISDADAASILQHYASVTGDDWVQFNQSRGLSGIDQTLLDAISDSRALLRFRYDGPPQITSVFPGVSTVRCAFIGYLYGA